MSEITELVLPLLLAIERDMGELKQNMIEASEAFVAQSARLERLSAARQRNTGLSREQVARIKAFRAAALSPPPCGEG
jgi:hypothetical protein